jgi:outer membrane protein OmpA-like peptidoglycan-associated protein
MRHCRLGLKLFLSAVLTLPFMLPSLSWGRTDFIGVTPSSDEIRAAFLKEDHPLDRQRLGAARTRGLDLSGSAKDEVQKYNQEQLAQAAPTRPEVYPSSPPQDARKRFSQNSAAQYIGPDYGFEEKSAEVRVSFDMIRFEFNSNRLTSEGFVLVRRIAGVLASEELDGSHFVIEGHTDAKGTQAYNQNLSQQRALAVRNALVGLGIDARRLHIRGRGSSMLLDQNNPYSGINRRVEFVKF